MPIEATVSFSGSVDVAAEDVISALNGNDELVLGFICQLLALSHSEDLRLRLAEALGFTVTHGREGEPLDGAHFERGRWTDEDFLPDGSDA